MTFSKIAFTLSMALWLCVAYFLYAFDQLSTAANNEEIMRALISFGAILVLAILIPVCNRLGRHEPRNNYRTIARLSSWLIFILLLMGASFVFGKRVYA